MEFAALLLPLLPRPERGVFALVGGGGKTAALFALGEELAPRGPERHVLLTTTTHLRDPRIEIGRLYDQLALVPELAEPGAPAALPACAPVPGRGTRLLVAAGTLPEEGRLRGILPARVAELARAWPYVAVEADGSKRLPVKAPAEHEPALPSCDLVLGVVGLGCLGRPMDGRSVHRPELFGPLTGCAPGEPIGVGHLAALCDAPQGLFKGVPPGTPRVLLLNQADRCPGDRMALLRGLRDCADRVLLASLAAPDPAARVVAVA
jgi:probable selenium-dependent hydroxylase accessory protein YqeC